MKFVKLQGTGNDFVLIDSRREESRSWPELARTICDRHFGVGADGILLVGDSAVADYRMIMYNPDGSEAEMCGNGIRCFAKYLYDSHAIGGSTIAIETGAGLKRVEIEAANGVARRVVVDMGAPIFEPSLIPVAAAGTEVIDIPRVIDGRALALTAVSMGNPHAIHFLDSDVWDFPLEQIGPLVEHDSLFPRRVNFEIAKVTTAEQIDVRVWERGAGITLACGTGACAVFAAARRKGLVGDRATLRLPGGELAMQIGSSGQILMAGPAEFVFSGEWTETHHGSIRPTAFVTEK
ncbi:MAG TPA: diaminopimelate epimerase [Chloroflexota bacterium]|nr:diaminopimelate epimerase [Chloroflexota bacterium]